MNHWQMRVRRNQALRTHILRFTRAKESGDATLVFSDLICGRRLHSHGLRDGELADMSCTATLFHPGLRIDPTSRR